MKLIYNNEKISTDILGLNRLLFGGIQLQDMTPRGREKQDSNKDKYTPRELTIVMSGKNGTCKALLAMQMLHGLTKNIQLLAGKNETDNRVKLGNSIFYSKARNENNLLDMFMDTIISKCVNSIIEDNIGIDAKWKGNNFCSTIFEVNPKDVCNRQLDFSMMDYSTKTFSIFSYS